LFLLLAGQQRATGFRAENFLREVKDRLIKKGDKYEYLTSSLNNSVRLLNALRIEVLFQMDLYRYD
jgi:hypothetical protein